MDRGAWQATVHRVANSQTDSTSMSMEVLKMSDVFTAHEKKLQEKGIINFVLKPWHMVGKASLEHVKSSM